MALSNTRCPIYYGMFRDAVLRGEILVNQEISMEMNRIDRWISDPNIYYDDEAVEGWIRFCENELTLTDGSDLHLLDSFKLWGEQIFGWYHFVERSVYEPYANGQDGHYVNKLVKMRMIHKQFLIVARGAAKSLYDECIHAYFLNAFTSISLSLRIVNISYSQMAFRTSFRRFWLSAVSLKLILSGSSLMKYKDLSSIGA